MKSSKDINKKRKLIDIERRRRYGISYSFKKLIEDEQNKLKDIDVLINMLQEQNIKQKNPQKKQQKNI